MSLGAINSGISSIQFLRAKQAFESTNKISKNNETLKLNAQKGFSEEDVKLSISSKNINIPTTAEEPAAEEFTAQTKESIGEIKKFINENNYQDVEEEDIKYALTSGKSILANYTA